MSDTTDHEETVSRGEASDRVRELAQALGGSGPTEVRVGNKQLTLSPGSVLDYGIEVEERSPMLGSDYEEITLTLSWETEDATETEDETE